MYMAQEKNIRKVNVIGENCPVPLVETRKAIMKCSEGECIEITGDHPASKKEIPMAIKEMGLKLLSIKEDGDNWTIKFENTKEGAG